MPITLPRGPKWSPPTRSARTSAIVTLPESLTCGADGRLLSGETLADVARAILPLRPDAVLANCAPARMMESLLLALRHECGHVPIGCYANIGEPDPTQGWRNTAEDPTVYAAFA